MTDLTAERELPAFPAMASLLTAFGNVAGAQRAGRDYAELSRLSDARLAEMGLERAELAAHVLRRHMR